MRARSLRQTLLIGILVPIALFILINSVSLYRQSRVAATTAYDRTLLASAKTIGEQLDVSGYDAQAQLRSTVPYSALEAFEADTQSRMYYRVSTLDGGLVTGFDDLAPWHGRIAPQPPYAALVDFYDGQFRDQPVRIAVLLQPVVSAHGRAMAVVQVAETLELRDALARKLLVDMLWRQLLLLAVVASVTVLVVQRATRPVRALGQAIEARADDDLSPIDAPDAPRELLPLIDATTAVMGRLQHLLDHQKRFVRESAHQLRTPLAVLKAQVQSAQRGDVPPGQALEEIRVTTERATQLANQMLSLAKVEQLRQQPESQTLDFAVVLREIVLDLSPLMADRDLDVGVHTETAPVHAHQWMLAELARNLIHNAIKHSPASTRLEIDLRRQDAQAVLTIGDDGPGIPDDLRRRLFEPFSAGDVAKGSGLGLAICKEITHALGGTLVLENRPGGGLDATARLPLRQQSDQQ